MVCISSLTTIARQRPGQLLTVIQSFELLFANLPPNFTRAQVSSVRKFLKACCCCCCCFCCYYCCCCCYYYYYCCYYYCCCYYYYYCYYYYCYYCLDAMFDSLQTSLCKYEFLTKIISLVEHQGTIELVRLIRNSY